MRLIVKRCVLVQSVASCCTQFVAIPSRSKCARLFSCVGCLCVCGNHARRCDELCAFVTDEEHFVASSLSAPTEIGKLIAKLVRQRKVPVKTIHLAPGKQHIESLMVVRKRPLYVCLVASMLSWSGARDRTAVARCTPLHRYPACV